MRLIELREERNLTQTDIANAIQTSRTNIGRWEKGENEPAASYVIKLADFFECTTDYLLGREDDFGNVTVKTQGATLSTEEEKLLDLFRELSPTHKAQVLGYVQATAQFAHPSKNILGRTNK